MLSSKVKSSLANLTNILDEQEDDKGYHYPYDRKLYSLNRQIRDICAELYDLNRIEGNGELLDPTTNVESKHPSIIDASIVPLSKTDDDQLDDYIKWLTLYSELSIFVMPFSVECLDITYSSSYGNNLEKSRSDLQTLIKYSKKYKHLLDAEMGVFLPLQNSYTITSWSDHSTELYSAPLIQEPDKFIYTPVNSKKNIFMGTSFQDFIIYKEIILPYFKTGDLDDLIKVAKNETESFVKFNHYLSKRLADISRVDSPRKLQEILQEIDYEVVNLKLEFKRLSKLKVLQGIEMAFFSISLSALILINTELVKQIAGISGSVSLLEIFREHLSASEQVASAKKSDFYLPYLLTKKSG